MVLKKSFIRNISPPKIIALGFFSVILIGTILLSLPMATKPGNHLTLIDALFTATSATCVTGLIVVDTGSFFSLFGQIVILSLIQIGGLGIMTFSTFFTLLIGQKISMKEQLVIRDALDYYELDRISSLVKYILIITFTIEFIGFIPLFLRWSNDFELKKAAYYALFHSISAFCNAGFSLFSSSLVSYKGDMTINFSIISLVLLGGLGFIVLLNLIQFLRQPKGLRRFSFQTKLVLSTTVTLIIVGAILLFLFEQGARFQDLTLKEKILSSLFQSVTPRTAGFNTIPIDMMSAASLFFITFLMFIGASPGSTGGGIKTTTFGILIASIYAMIRDNDNTEIFKKTIPRKTVHKATAIVGISVLVVTTFIFLLLIVENKTTLGVEKHGFLIKILFEVISAFGTVGLSTGITPQLSNMGRLIIIATMFMGRVGPLTLALAIGAAETKADYKYPEARVTVG